jgi:endo-1,3(4)-beta-glucanase
LSTLQATAGSQFLISNPTSAIFATASMGPSHSKPASPSTRRTSAAWLDTIVPSRTRKGFFNSFGYPSAPTAAAEIPSDNIFVPIQEDNILPQVPIGRHHPVPRKGVEDGDKRTMNTNKFYANTFLGDQSKPIWTHPYSVWWGKGWEEPGMMKTWGMCISHIEESDFAYGDGDHTNACTRMIPAECNG